MLAVELGCGLMILLGFQTRAAAVLLAGFCIVTAVVLHRNFADRNQLLHFEKDLAIAGGFLVLAAFGAGQYAVLAIASSGAVYDPGARPVTNAATARRSAGLSDAPRRRMLNEPSAVSTASGVKPRSASRLGIRGSDPS